MCERACAMASSSRPSSPTDQAALALPAGALARPSRSIGTRAGPNAPAARFGRTPVLDEFAARLLLAAHLNPHSEDTLLATSGVGPTLDSQRPAVRAHDNIIDTTKLHLGLAAPPMWSKKQIAPLQHELDLAEEERQRIEIALNAGGEARPTGRRRSTMGRAPSKNTRGTKDTVRSVARRGVPAVNALSGNAS